MDYIPGKDSDKVIWNNNLSAKINADGPDLGLEADEISEINKTCDANVAAIVANDTAQQASKTAKAAKDKQLSTGNRFLRSMVKKMKGSSKYSTILGVSLGIIGDDPTIDYRIYQPKIKPSVMPGHVRIDFVKNGLNGMNIYGRLKSENKWVKLAYNSYSPYLDSRPLTVDNVPEHREYMAIGVMHDQEVTLQSTIIEAVYGGL
ncbi:hypothetical protein [Flavobacterium sp. SM2513]|uniref:hypothetical protein n=1 Tax=Flavobacterium sp. SM2513 TaxID=3424766 RepID=UPI003D7F4F07